MTFLTHRIEKILRAEAGLVVLASVLSNLVRFGSTIVLSRLLSPEDFGAVGLITSVMFVLNMLSDFGFQAYLLRSPRANEQAFIDQVWTIRLIRGAIICLVIQILASAISDSFGRQELAIAVRIASISFFVDGLASLGPILGIRTRQLRRVAIVDLGTQGLQVLVTIGLACIFKDYLALVYGIVCGSVFRMALTYVVFPSTRQHLVLTRESFVEIWKFSRTIALNSSLTLILVQTDKLILAKALSLADFGFYTMAVSLVAAPQLILSNLMSQLAYPRFVSALRGGIGDRTCYYEVMRKVSLLFLFFAGGLLGGGELLIFLLYDPRYQSVTIFFSLLMLSPIFGFGCSMSAQYFNAVDRTNWILHANIVRILGFLMLVGIGFYFYGPLGIVVAVGLQEALPLLFCWLRLRKLGILRPAEEVRLYGSAGLGVIVGAMVSYLALAFLR